MARNQVRVRRSTLALSASVVALLAGASAYASTPQVLDSVSIPAQSVASALRELASQTGANVLFAPSAVQGLNAPAVSGRMTPDEAARRLVAGTPLEVVMNAGDAIVIREAQASAPKRQLVAAAGPTPAAQTAVETVVVTAQHKREDIQQVPIAVTALSQQQLTERQIAGGPDLVKEVPNLNFSKTNFTGYNLEIRGIGTQAISVTTDPAVAVAFNDIPFIRNHFFEQEFYDLQDAEVLRGPQGTLFGRNATAGVVNIKSALPDDQYEAMLSADFGNYGGQRLEGMVNFPVATDKLDVRVAAEWTKRDGYTEDQELGTSVDGRDLWSGRLTVGFNPTERFKSDFVWEHFSEDDDRMRSAKQLCEKDNGPTSVDGLDLMTLPNPKSDEPADFGTQFARTWLSQGCLPTSLYSPSAYETPNGQTLPFVALGEFVSGDILLNDVDPYANQTQPMNLRVIQSLITPHYRAKNDTLEYNANFALTPELTMISETGYNSDFLFSTEDFNRFDTQPGMFAQGLGTQSGAHGADAVVNGVYCDPQVGCSSSMVGEDLSDENSWQFSQEVRIESQFKGPLNFSFGGNYLRYHTIENYYVFFNFITAETQLYNGQGPGQYSDCLSGVTPGSYGNGPYLISQEPFLLDLLGRPVEVPSVLGCNGISLDGKAPGAYIDPNPIGSLNGQGHNYFRSENPYDLNSYAGFGEVYYDVTSNLKLTGGLRWTDDRKVFTNIPSETFEGGGGYPIEGFVKQGWNEWTGRFNASWSPELDFTDQSMIYASYAHGYKGGGANPPGPIADFASAQSSVTHPPTFAPEHIEAYEVGTKNTALDGALTVDGDIFFYNYHGYQISQIVDRTSINLNFNATIEGAELESTWEPIPGLKFNLAGGWEDTAVDKNQYAIDLMDRTAGVPGWVVVKPYIDETSNCILPAKVVRQILQVDDGPGLFGQGLDGACDAAYLPGSGIAGLFGENGEDQTAFAAAGFNPATAPNNGEGFFKNLSGNKLPNAPPFTLSTGAQYSMPVSADWAATLRGDFYWQGNTFARIFNDQPYDSIKGYTNLNLALMLDSQDGWDVMFYVKNVFDVTAITGAFLNSDDTGLTTNVFVTDPRLFGVRVTKQLDGNDGLWGSHWTGADLFKDIFADADNGRPLLWVEIGGQWGRNDAGVATFRPPFMAASPFGMPPALDQVPRTGWDSTAKISIEPDGDWILSAQVQFGRSTGGRSINHQTVHASHGSYGAYDAYQESAGQAHEQHMIVDFEAGKDFGLGKFWDDQISTVNAGVRIAQFNLSSGSQFASQPTNIASGGVYHIFRGNFAAKRSFNGIGPSISWDASETIAGDSSNGSVTLDWGANGAVLFGRQRVQGHHQSTDNLKHNIGYVSVHQTSRAISRGKGATVPNLGGFAGVSYRLSNAKISFGYRADEFFGAMDGGIDSYKSENRGFFGPFANISVGIGG